MSNTAKKLENIEDIIIKTASYHNIKNDFNIYFLNNSLSNEIKKLVELQSSTLSLLDEIIKDLKTRPFNGGLE